MQNSNIILNKEHQQQKSTSSRISKESFIKSTENSKSGLQSPAGNLTQTSTRLTDASAFSATDRRSPFVEKGDRLSPDTSTTFIERSHNDIVAIRNRRAMQLSLLQQQQSGLKQLDKPGIVIGLPTADSPSSNREESGGKESVQENPITAAMAAAAATSGVSSGGISFNPASILSSHLGSQQMQQLLSQQVLSPPQLQAFMQQHQVMAVQQQQAQQLQELYRQQQKHIHDIQMQMARQQGKRSGAASSGQNDFNNNNNSGDESKHGADQQTQAQIQQQLALQQLVQLQQMQAQHQQQQQQAAALQQQQGLAAAAAAALAHGRQLPPPELQQIWKQMTESAALQAAAVMAAASGGKSRPSDRFDTPSRDKLFTSPSEDRKPFEMNGDMKRSSRESSPGVTSSTSTTNHSTRCLFSHGVCKWPGCDTECSDQAEFRRHLNQDHRLDDRSTAQCRVQMQVVEQLEKQLNQDRERLNAMMTHLHNMEDIREQQMQQDRDMGRGIGGQQDVEDISRSIDHQSRTSLIKSELSFPHPLVSQASAHMMGPMFTSVGGSVLGAAGSSLSLPSSPNGFPSSMLQNSLSHSPPSMTSHFSANGSVNNISSRDGLIQSARRRHSNAIPISAELSQNQEFYKNADVRPPYTYASLIRQAIIETHDHQLTLNEIYNWFQRKFAYFRRNTATWKNAVRHNLSLHKCFVRVENVKGAVWTVDENEYQKRRPQKFSGSSIMRGRIENPCYYGSSINPMQMALGEAGFNSALFAASQAQAAILSGQASGNFRSLSQQTSTAVTETLETTSSGSRKRSVSPSSLNHRYSDDSPTMEKVKRERMTEFPSRVNTDMNIATSDISLYESSAQSPDSSLTTHNKTSVESRNANNNNYAGSGEYSPEPQSPEMTTPLDMSRVSPLQRQRRNTPEDSAITQHRAESDESDSAIEGEMRQHSSSMLPTRGSFTMLHEQPSD